MTNRTSPASVRLTPAAYLLMAFFGLLALTVTFYLQDQGIAYCASLPATVLAFLLMADQMHKYSH